MSIRGADEKAIGDERRRGSGKRVRFEALVAVGDAEGGAGFEAESLDVSPEGMRLRTAYLPEIGDRLICRFEGAGTEVLAEAEVTWREEQERGGEFGLRFLKLDADAAERLRVMCAPTEAEGATDDAPVPMGARVRLHIDGLASPMKARVREASTGELRVGSNLEFLRVGQKLDLEDVDQKGKRNVVIDHVAVEIDPETNVPQLVVSLRYPTSKAAAALAAGAAVGAGVAAGAAAERVSKTLISPRPDAPVAPLAKRSAPVVETQAASELDASSSADAETDVAVDDEEQEAVDKMHAGLRGAGVKAKAKAKAMADKLGPTLASMAATSKEKLGALFAKLAKNREERAVAKKAAGPRRMTSPPPKGALTSEGRRLVRDDEPELSEPISLPKRKLGRSAVMGGLLGLLLVIGIVSASKLMGGSVATAEATAPGGEVAALAAAQVAPVAPVDPANGGTVVANVPLFGATPLSTTEPVPTAPPGDPALALNGADPLLQAANAAAGGPDEEDAPSAGQGDEGDPDDVATDVTEWGSGKVHAPVVLKLKMDGDVSRLDGAKGAMGFTISVPGRRALGTGAELAKKDKRIAAVDVVNTGSGAEVTVRFKDGVPPYLVKANGARLEIAIGSDGKGKTKAVASKKSEGKSKKVDAKKTTKGKTDKKAKTKAKPAKKTTAKH